MIRIYGLKTKDKKLTEILKKLVKEHYPLDVDLKVVAEYSNKGNFKGLSVYNKGSKSLKAYFDLKSMFLHFYIRGRLESSINLKP